MQVPRNTIREPNSTNWHVQKAGKPTQFCRSTSSLSDRDLAPCGACPGWRADLKAHMDRVGAMSTLVAEAVGLNFRDAELVGGAARVHDLGKVFIPTAILEKPGPLNEDETRIMRTHTVLGHSVLRRTEDPALGLAAKVALEHHENWDGSGYPYGLSGEDIGLAARIVSVCDVYDSLRDERPYKPALSHRRAMSTITEGDGRTRPTMFDPSVLDAFVRNQHLCRAIFVSSVRFPSPLPLPQFLQARAA
jgi:putative two-component system response regulator